MLVEDEVNIGAIWLQNALLCHLVRLLVKLLHLSVIRHKDVQDGTLGSFIFKLHTDRISRAREEAARLQALWTLKSAWVHSHSVYEVWATSFATW